MRSPALCLLAVLFVASSSTFSASPLAALSLEIGLTTVAADGVTPDGEVAWLSVSRRPLGTHQQVEIRRELGQADASGRAELELADEVTDKSIWAVVDLATGGFVVAAPPESTLLERALQPGAFEVGTEGSLIRLHHDRLRIEALVVRPATSSAPASAWAGQVEDGGALDEGAAYDGEVDLSPGSLPALIEGQALATAFERGDVVVLIDPEELEVTALRLEEQAGQGGAQ